MSMLISLAGTLTQARMGVDRVTFLSKGSIRGFVLRRYLKQIKIFALFETRMSQWHVSEIATIGKQNKLAVTRRRICICLYILSL